jgi:hypothetical protein
MHPGLPRRNVPLVIPAVEQLVRDRLNPAVPFERRRPLDYSNLEPPPTAAWTGRQRAALAIAVALFTWLVFMFAGDCVGGRFSN